MNPAPPVTSTRFITPPPPSIVFEYAPDGARPVLSVDLLHLVVCADGVIDIDFVDAASSIGHLGVHLQFEPAPFLGEVVHQEDLFGV